MKEPRHSRSAGLRLYLWLFLVSLALLAWGFLFKNTPGGEWISSVLVTAAILIIIWLELLELKRALLIVRDVYRSGMNGIRQELGRWRE